MRYTIISAEPIEKGEKRREEWEMTFPKTGKYVVDDSKFIPMSEMVKRAAAQRSNGNDVKDNMNYYDFPTGKDNGMDIPRSRTEKDLAELSVTIRKEGQKLQKKQEAAAAEAAKKQMIAEKMAKFEKSE